MVAERETKLSLLMKDNVVTAGGIRTAYVEAGSGRPLICIHGSEFAVDGRTSFQYQLSGLSDRFRVLVPDQRHFGRTEYPLDRRYRNRLERTPHVIDFLEALRLDQPAIVVGHSEGAFVASLIAIRRPDLVAGLVLLTSSGTAPAFGDERDGGWEEASMRLYDYKRPQPTEAEFLDNLRSLFGKLDPEAEALRKSAFETATANGQWELLASDTDDGDASYSRLQETHLFPHLGALNCPVQIIWSKDDETAPAERGVLLAQRIQHADFHVLSGAKHAVQIHRFAAVNALIRAWSDTVPLGS